MQTSVNLQEPFSYSIYYIIIVVIFILAITIYYFFSKGKKSKEIVIKVKDLDINYKNAIKQKYIKEIDELEEKINNNEINIRIAYQNLSSIIRHFIYEMTNIKVQNYTLRDIRSLNMPVLYELIKEYYIPEFAKKSLGNIKSSIEKTRKVIEKWN